jgi:hypothetical protein
LPQPTKWPYTPRSQLTPDELAAARARDKRKYRGQCASCGKPVSISRSSRPEIICQKCRRKQTPAPQPAICELCGKSYLPGLRGKGRVPQRFCSLSCAAKSQRAKEGKGDGAAAYARKRARVRARRLRHSSTWDGVTDEQILERDRWMCWICHRKIGKTFKWPHPRSASIDHELPLALGGDDTALNKRAAHLRCNLLRGTGKPYEQYPFAFALDPDTPLPQRRPPGRQGKPCPICGERLIAGRCMAHQAIHVYTCRYCGKAGVTRKTGTKRQVCERAECQKRRHAPKKIDAKPRSMPESTTRPRLHPEHHCPGCEAITQNFMWCDDCLRTNVKGRRRCHRCQAVTQNYRWCDDCLCTSSNTKGKRCRNVATSDGQCEYHSGQRLALCG